MEKSVVLQLMRERADTMAGHPSYEALVNRLADLLADSRGRLSKDNFDDLILLGAALFKAGLSQFHARQDVSQLMDSSFSTHDTANVTPLPTSDASQRPTFMFPSKPQPINGGITFRVWVDSRYGTASRSSPIRECFISDDALLMLSEKKGFNWDTQETFQRLENVILGVARRLAQAGVSGTPLRLERTSFH